MTDINNENKKMPSLDAIQNRVNTLEENVDSLRGEVRDGFKELAVSIVKLGEERKSAVQKELDDIKSKRPSMWAVPGAAAATLAVASFLGGGLMWVISLRTAPLDQAIAMNTGRIDNVIREMSSMSSAIALDRQKAVETTSRVDDLRRWQNEELFVRKPGERDARFEENLKLLAERNQRLSDRADRIDARIERLQGGARMPTSLDLRP